MAEKKNKKEADEINCLRSQLEAKEEALTKQEQEWADASAKKDALRQVLWECKMKIEEALDDDDDDDEEPEPVLVDCEDCKKIEACIEREEKRLEKIPVDERTCPRLAYDGEGYPRGYCKIECSSYEEA